MTRPLPPAGWSSTGTPRRATAHMFAAPRFGPTRLGSSERCDARSPAARRSCWHAGGPTPDRPTAAATVTALHDPRTWPDRPDDAPGVPDPERAQTRPRHLADRVARGLLRPLRG